MVGKVRKNERGGEKKHQCVRGEKAIGSGEYKKQTQNMRQTQGRKIQQGLSTCLGSIHDVEEAACGDNNRRENAAPYDERVQFAAVVEVV